MAGVFISSGFQGARVFGQLIMVCPAQVGMSVRDREDSFQHRIQRITIQKKLFVNCFLVKDDKNVIH